MGPARVVTVDLGEMTRLAMQGCLLELQQAQLERMLRLEQMWQHQGYLALQLDQVAQVE